MAKIYETRLISELLGQGALNRFYYLALGGLEDPLAVAFFFVSDILPFVINIMTEDTTVKRVDVTNVLDPNETVSISGTVIGARASDTNSSFNAHSFQLMPSSALFKRGGKRFPGVPDDFYTLGVPTSGAVTLLEDLSEALIQAWVVDDNNKIVPGLARETTPTSWLFSQIIAAPFNYISTQNSRKAYSGGGPISPFTGFYDQIVNFQFVQTTYSGGTGYDSQTSMALGDLTIDGDDPLTSGAKQPGERATAVNGTVDNLGNLTLS